MLYAGGKGGELHLYLKGYSLVGEKCVISNAYKYMDVACRTAYPYNEHSAAINDHLYVHL